MALQTESRNQYDFASATRDNASEAQAEESFSMKHGLLGELYELILKIGHSLIGARTFNKRCSGILGEGLAQLSLWREYFPDITVSELPKNNEYSQLDRSALKLLFEAGKTVQKLANGLQYSTKVLPSDLQRFYAVTDRAEYLVGSSDDPDPRSDDEYSSGASDSAAATASSMRELVDLFSTHIRCLMRLGPTIQDAFIEEAHHLDELPAHRDQSFKLHGPSAYYVSLIIDRFKSPDRDLADKLGEANWQRSERVRWTQALDPLDGPMSTSKLTELIGVAPSSVFAPTTVFHDSGLGTSIPALTQYAASLVTTITAQAGNAARVPPTPPEVKHKKPFDCWICKTMVSHVKDRHQWKMHVFADLQPYVCCVSSCRHLLTFPSRDQWLDHTFHQHPAEDVFGRNSNRWDEETMQCLLCQGSIRTTRKDYGKHLGRHLESIALASLPKDVDRENESSFSSASDAESDFLVDVKGTSSTLQKSKVDTRSSSELRPDGCTLDATPEVEEPQHISPETENNILDRRSQKHPATFQCDLCPTRVSSVSRLRSHLKTHTDERPFTCTVCFKTFARQQDRKRHETLNCKGEKKFICRGQLSTPGAGSWGCGRTFARGDALGRHFRSEKGRACIRPLLEEEREFELRTMGNKGVSETPITGLSSSGEQEDTELAARTGPSSVYKPLYSNKNGEKRRIREVASNPTHSRASAASSLDYSRNQNKYLAALSDHSPQDRAGDNTSLEERFDFSTFDFGVGANEHGSESNSGNEKAWDSSFFDESLFSLDSDSREQTDDGPSNAVASTPRTTPSSYWSVQEVERFEKLLDRHGSDWTAIARELGTKTATMVKNQYNRLINNYDRSNLQDIVKQADLREHQRSTPGTSVLDQVTGAVPARGAAATANVAHVVDERRRRRREEREMRRRQDEHSEFEPYAQPPRKAMDHLMSPPTRSSSSNNQSGQISAQKTSPPAPYGDTGLIQLSSPTVASAKSYTTSSQPQTQRASSSKPSLNTSDQRKKSSLAAILNAEDDNPRQPRSLGLYQADLQPTVSVYQHEITPSAFKTAIEAGTGLAASERQRAQTKQYDMYEQADTFYEQSIRPQDATKYDPTNDEKEFHKTETQDVESSAHQWSLNRQDLTGTGSESDYGIEQFNAASLSNLELLAVSGTSKSGADPQQRVSVWDTLDERNGTGCPPRSPSIGPNWPFEQYLFEDATEIQHQRAVSSTQATQQPWFSSDYSRRPKSPGIEPESEIIEINEEELNGGPIMRPFSDVDGAKADFDAGHYSIPEVYDQGDWSIVNQTYVRGVSQVEDDVLSKSRKNTRAASLQNKNEKPTESSTIDEILHMIERDELPSAIDGDS